MKKQILIVDDEDDILNLVRLILEDEGFECDVARDGKEGLEMIRKKRFDLVLLDIMMPFRTGWEVLRELRASELTKNLPIAMLTARASPQDYQGSDLPFFSDYITKPFEPEDLVRRVKKILRTAD
ncbi:MAG TPA: response regulator transcription factor [Acidobacteriota bacterium]|jgi:DNA-binding response OmpR family regulator|nr:response regulator transcription factor [Acidobacteriota bacterium]